jgi:hypothetical protein
MPTMWNLNQVDHPWRLRRLTRIRRERGELRYRLLRLSMSVAENRRDLRKHVSELKRMQSELRRSP